MQARSAEFTYDIKLEPGEALSLPEEAAKILGPGRWLVSIRPADVSPQILRDHTSFLNSYAPEDEGLYDDLSSQVKSGWLISPSPVAPLPRNDQ
jgi:hypothetical protein